MMGRFRLPHIIIQFLASNKYSTLCTGRCKYTHTQTWPLEGCLFSEVSRNKHKIDHQAPGGVSSKWRRRPRRNGRGRRNQKELKKDVPFLNGRHAMVQVGKVQSSG